MSGAVRYRTRVINFAHVKINKHFNMYVESKYALQSDSVPKKFKTKRTTGSIISSFK